MIASASIDADPQPVLWMSDFGAGYGNRIVLDDICLEIPRSGLWAVMGPSGVGKSTLLRVICGVAQQNANLKLWGEMRYQGLLAGEQGWPTLLAQDARLMVSSVLENLTCGLPDRASLNLREQRARILEHLSRYGCEQLQADFDRQVVELSLARQRIVAILRQTLCRPAMLCADEPTAGLDENDSAPVLALLRQCARSCTIMLASHDQRAVRNCADQVVLLASGRVQETNSSAAFFSHPTSAAAIEFVNRGTCTSVRPDAIAGELDPSVIRLPPLSTGARQAKNAWAGPRGFVWLRKGQLAGTPMPGVVGELVHDLDALKRVGVTRLLTLLECPLDCQTELAERGMAATHMPIEDMAAPDLDQAQSLCRHIDRWLHEREVVAVHCRAGHGRTGTALAAWRIWHGESAPEAIEGIRQLERRWIQSREQAEFLRRFELHLRSMQGGRSDLERDPIGST